MVGTQYLSWPLLVDTTGYETTPLGRGDEAERRTMQC